jgi:hypothetical protein
MNRFSAGQGFVVIALLAAVLLRPAAADIERSVWPLLAKAALMSAGCQSWVIRPVRPTGLTAGFFGMYKVAYLTKHRPKVDLRQLNLDFKVRERPCFRPFL